VLDNNITWKAFPDTKPVTGAAYKEFWKQTGTNGGSYAQNTEYRAVGDVLLNQDVMSVLKVWYRDSQSGDVKIDMVSRDEWNGIVDKFQTGRPIYAFYEDTFTPYLRLWPQPDSTDYLIMYDAVTVFNDMDLSTDTGITTQNYLNRWVRYLSYELAAHLGEEYQLKSDKILRLERKAAQYKSFAIMKDSDTVTKRFTTGSY
jgi:hypothetical protein